jgi:serine/threonine protein phosphatase PrpC
MGWGRQDLMSRWFRRRAPTAAPIAVAPRAAPRTDVGRVRKINEDRVLDRGENGLWAVADGMGGMRAGDVAAQTVVDLLAGLELVSPDAITQVLQAANATIHATGGGTSGATIVAAHVAGDAATILWAGDSRAYQVRAGKVRQVTRDHSFVQDMVDRGLIEAADADSHPRANVITRAVGVAADLQLDRVSLALEAGDRLFLCSDGVSRSLDLADLARAEPIDVLADRLLAAALERDGSDNASLVLIEV